VLLPSDTHGKPITSITAVLLPLVNYLLTLPHSCVFVFFVALWKWIEGCSLKDVTLLSLERTLVLHFPQEVSKRLSLINGITNIVSLRAFRTRFSLYTFYSS
jgi:hypothetical protein